MTPTPTILESKKREFFHKFNPDFLLIGSNSVHYDGDDIGYELWSWIITNFQPKDDQT